MHDTLKVDPPLRERIAALAHASWSGWWGWQSQIGTEQPDGGLVIPPGSVSRWNRQASTPYRDLPETEKPSDRTEADHYLAAFRTYVDTVLLPLVTLHAHEEPKDAALCMMCTTCGVILARLRAQIREDMPTVE